MRLRSSVICGCSATPAGFAARCRCKGIKAGSAIMMRIIEGDLGDRRVIDLLQAHLTSARAETAPGSAHALDLAGRKSSDIRVWTIWEGDTLVGVGALKRLWANDAAVKSMHTAQAMRGKRAGSAMLRHIIAAAKAARVSRLSLETGSWEYFDPARRFYRKHGFVECPPFADYV